MVWFNFHKKSNTSYLKAKESINSAFEKINGKFININPLDVLYDQGDLPEDVVDAGKIRYDDVFQNKHIKVIRMFYEKWAQPKIHTHYGFYSCLFIEKGRFKGVKGVDYKTGDIKIREGHIPHSFLSMEDEGEVLILYSKTKSLATYENIKKYINPEFIKNNTSIIL